jgi:hypothetical protein
MLLVASLVLLRYWSAASPYVSQMACAVITVGAVCKMLPFVAVIDGVRFDAGDPTTAAEWLRCLMKILVQCLLLDAFVYTRCLLFANVVIPLGCVVTFFTTPRASLAHMDLVAVAPFFMGLWLNMLHSVAQRKQFLAEGQHLETMAEALDAELRHAQAGLESDHLVNHHLGSVLADVKGCILLFLDDRSADEYLHQSLQRLECGIKWCRGHSYDTFQRRNLN